MSTTPTWEHFMLPELQASQGGQVRQTVQIRAWVAQGADERPARKDPGH